MQTDDNSRWMRRVGLCAIILLFGASVAAAAHHEAKETTAADVKQQVAETYNVLEQYTIEQKDEAMATAKKTLSEFDARINSLQDRVDRGWEEMNADARQQTRQALDALRQGRNEVAEWYGGMRQSSAEAWDEVKKGFAESYDRLEQAFGRASEEFKALDEKPRRGKS